MRHIEDVAVEEVLTHATAFARQAATTPELASLFETACIGLLEQARRFGRPFFVDLPLLVYASVRGGDVTTAIPLAAATALFFLGLDIADDIMDRDLPAFWSSCSPSDIHIAEVAMVATLPQLLIASLDAPAATRERMQATLAQATLRMMGGQQRDVNSAGSVDVNRARVVESVVAKSGEELALFASLAAQLAGADRDQVAQYEAMGRGMGTSAQLTGDCYDVFIAPHSKDLAAGTRTLPITLGLDCVEGDDRTQFVTLLDRARSDPAAAAAVREQLRDVRVHGACALYIALYRRRAQAALEASGAREPARARLRAMIESAVWPPPAHVGE